MPLRNFVRLTGDFEGLHHWPQAPATEDYLRSPHRHLFTVDVELEVVHDDREIEINAAARWLSRQLPGLGAAPPAPGRAADLGAQSCEQLAARILDLVLDRYGRHRHARCTVLEDGMLGGGVTWEPDPLSAPAG